MYIPAARERVEVVGRPGVFLVLAVDCEEQFATVIPLSGASVYVEEVGFAQLRPHRPDVSMEGKEQRQAPPKVTAARFPLARAVTWPNPSAEPQTIRARKALGGD